MDLNISNIVNISVAAEGTGISQYNTSNLALFTRDTPGMSFGSDPFKIYLDPVQVGIDFGTGSLTYAMALQVFSQQPNILANNGYLVVIPLLTSPSAETIDAAITRTANLVQYFGVMVTETADVTTQSTMLAAAAIIQTMNKLMFWVSRLSASIAPSGILDQLRSHTYHQNRGLYYGGAADADALGMMSAYAGRALSTNFNGSLTTETMHLKDLIGVNPDPSMTQNLYNEAQTAGVDIYASIQGVPKTISFGANDFFDNQYNLQWFVGALQVAGFNVLAQTSTKIPQTENGVSVLKNAYRNVCEQAVANGFAAPGQWNNPTTFGNQSDLFQNVAQRGYYIYSQPVSQQLPSVRAQRQAPLIQIALKYAGAIHSSTVIVNVNA